MKNNDESESRSPEDVGQGIKAEGKLRLDRERIRYLSGGELAAVAGGQSGHTMSTMLCETK
jgi:hypothetical protein